MIMSTSSLIGAKYKKKSLQILANRIKGISSILFKSTQSKVCFFIRYILRQTFIIRHHLGKRCKDVVTRDLKVNIFKMLHTQCLSKESRIPSPTHSKKSQRAHCYHYTVVCCINAGDFTRINSVFLYISIHFAAGSYILFALHIMPKVHNKYWFNSNKNGRTKRSLLTQRSLNNQL